MTNMNFPQNTYIFFDDFFTCKYPVHTEILFIMYIENDHISTYDQVLKVRKWFKVIHHCTVQYNDDAVVHVWSLFRICDFPHLKYYFTISELIENFKSSTLFFMILKTLHTMIKIIFEWGTIVLLVQLGNKSSHLIGNN